MRHTVATTKNGTTIDRVELSLGGILKKKRRYHYPYDKPKQPAPKTIVHYVIVYPDGTTDTALTLQVARKRAKQEEKNHVRPN